MATPDSAQARDEAQLRQLIAAQMSAIRAKEQIIKRIKEEGVPVAQAAKEHGIHEITVYGSPGAGAERAPSRVEVAKLKRENQALLGFVSN
jgi:hypothetical protein